MDPLIQKVLDRADKLSQDSDNRIAAYVPNPDKMARIILAAVLEIGEMLKEPKPVPSATPWSGLIESKPSVKAPRKKRIVKKVVR